MKVLLVLMSGFIWFSAVSQQVESGVAKDSLMQAQEQRIAEYRRNREIYQKLYAENPREAVEWKINNRYAKLTGTARLEGYLNNQRIDTLKEINLSAAGLDKVPEFVFGAKKLEVLILDDNRIRKLPKELTQLGNLKRIYWRGNALDDFRFIRIQKIKGLQRLDISDNLLTRMPLGIRKLEGLKELVAEENFFGAVPVSRLKHAETLEIVSLSKAHDLTLGETDYAPLNYLKVFKANKCQLKSIDPSFYQMAGLNELQLQENELTEIPEGISALKNLTKLSFYKNQLKSLPDDLFDLNLKVIDLYYNDLEVIPSEIGNLTDLEILFLAHNKIYSLPESIGELTNLDELYLHHNRLSVLPGSLSQLNKLRVVRVNDNYLEDFPSQFLGIQSIVDLDISNNQIKTIPDKLASQKNLQLFTYQDNPMNFDKGQNEQVAQMIYQMSQKGVICVPRVYLEESE
jgi:Leucine-rich repeat (LRR) protein